MSANRLLKKGKIQYFELVPYEEWSFEHFTSWVLDKFGQTENNGVFYNVFYIIRDDISASEEVHNAVRRLLNRKNDKKRVNGESHTLTDITNSVKTVDNISDVLREMVIEKERPKREKKSLRKVIKKNNENNRTVIQKLTNIEGLVKELQKSEIAISNIKCNEWEKIQMSTGLGFEAIDFNLEHETKSNAFQWDDRPEREQKDRYLPHLRKILQISKYRKLEIYDTTRHINFLSMSTDILPIRLVGTTDATVVDRFSISSRIPQHHIRILFELKKFINDGHLYQALAELTYGDLKSIHAILAVLTDLRDDWQFFYFEDEKIGTFTLPRGKAVALIQINMKFANQELNNEIEVTEPLPKRRKLEHIMNI
ncbi:7355_t:CDS:2, partial [Funneliformis geosporum]